MVGNAGHFFVRHPAIADEPEKCHRACMINKHFRVQAYNNAWANLRLGRACLTLPSAEISKTRTGFFPSLIETLNHILIVDWFYVSAFEGRSMGLDAFASHVPFPDLAELIEEQKKIDKRLIAVCCDPTKSREDNLIEMDRGKSIQIERFDRTFFHLIQHQIHHRGQVHCMLSGTDAAPPQLDEFFMGSDADKNLRAGDLKELGITEEDLWRDF